MTTRPSRPPNRPIRFRSALHNTISDVFKARGYKETDSELDWDIHWSDIQWMREVFDHVHLEEHQRVNHFRNHYELTRKDLLVKNVKRMKKQLEKEEKYSEAAQYSFIPASYVLPAEYGLFSEEFKKNPGAAWIMKPVGKAQGRGIFLFNKLSSITDWKKDYRWRNDPNAVQPETYIVQKYIENPYLIGGKKFDLRIYVLVTSYQPLTVYLYRNGFSRFSFHRFSMNAKEIENNYIHLTNVAIQKTSSSYASIVKSQGSEGGGCKWSLRNLKTFLISRAGSGPSSKRREQVEELFSNIQAMILRSLVSVARSIINDRHCFELYGYDVLIDDNLKPWLLEVNASPSLTAETSSDYQLKFQMLMDTLNVIDLEKSLTGNEESIGGYDLICKGTPVFERNGALVPTNLGNLPEKRKPKSQSSTANSSSTTTNTATPGATNALRAPTPKRRFGPANGATTEPTSHSFASKRSSSASLNEQPSNRSNASKQ